MKIFDKTVFNSVFVTKFGLILLMMLLLVGDTLTSFFIKENLKFSIFFKAIITFLLIVNLAFSNKTLFIGVILLCLSVSVGIGFNNLNDFIPKTSLVFEYLSGLLFFNYLILSNNKKTLSSIFAGIFIFYCLTILIAFIFQIDYLKTYYGERFGYMPFFSSQNEFSFIIIATIIYFYKIYLNTPSKINLLFIIMALISSLLVGTKVLYAFVLIFIAYLILKKFNFKILALITGFALILLLFLKNHLFNFLYTYNKVLMDVYSEHGLINFISSLRYEFLEDRLECQFLTMDSYNYLFGGINMKCFTEMSLIDILLTFGLLGSILYFYLLRRFILLKLDLDIFGCYAVTIITLLSFLGGYFFENLSAQFYVIGVLYIFYYRPTTDAQKIKEQ